MSGRSSASTQTGTKCFSTKARTFSSRSVVRLISAHPSDQRVATIRSTGFRAPRARSNASRPHESQSGAAVDSDMEDQAMKTGRL